jgi:protein-tyrosine phosphatase
MKPPASQPAFDPNQPPPPRRGQVAAPAMRIDIHSHLLPNIDDGCISDEESLECVRRLKEAGYLGTICTPHIWPEAFPQNLPMQVRAWAARFGDLLEDMGIEYRVWPGGELRLYDGVIPFIEKNGVPTLADSRFVLVDFWDRQWPKWANSTFEWFLKHKYRPILAHPERIPDQRGDLDARLREVEAMGVLLQGNARSLTGAEGLPASMMARQLLGEQRYHFYALDMHRPETLMQRLDGMSLLEVEYGQKLHDHFTITAPRVIAKP